MEYILEKAATTFPFENLRILSNKTEAITKENLVHNILVKKEGGLCYELNPLLYFFLVESGFHAVLVRGEVYNHAEKDWSNLGRTHVTVLLHHDGQVYLVDSGFGGNLPLKPVPLTGGIVTSRNGDFRVKQMKSDFGNHVLEMKLKVKDTDWRKGYAFDSSRPLGHLSELNEVQSIIVGHEHSPFNKAPLITRLTGDGNITLTDTSFTRWRNGEVKKEQINNSKFGELARL